MRKHRRGFSALAITGALIGAADYLYGEDAPPQSKVCTIEGKSDKYETSGISYGVGYGSGAQFRSDITNTSIQDHTKKETDHLLVKSNAGVPGGTAYLWKNQNNQGVKFHVEEIQADKPPSVARFGGKLKFNCHYWSPDYSKLEVPANITFTEISKKEISPTPPVPKSPTETVIFKAPFSRYVRSYFHSPVSSNPEQAVCRGLSGFPKVQTDKSTGLIGYSGFAWGGFCGHYDLFGTNNSPTQQATSESLLGDIFTAPVSGTYRISADIELHGNGTASAGAGASDIIQALVPGKVGTAIGLANPAQLFPSAASAQNTFTLLVGNTDNPHSNSHGLPNLAVDSTLHRDQDEVFTGTQTLTTTVHLSAGQQIVLLSGLKTKLKAWGNATAVVKPLNSKLNRIVVQLVSQ